MPLSGNRAIFNNDIELCVIDVIQPWACILQDVSSEVSINIVLFNLTHIFAANPTLKDSPVLC